MKINPALITFVITVVLIAVLGIIAVNIVTTSFTDNTQYVASNITTGTSLNSISNLLGMILIIAASMFIIMFLMIWVSDANRFSKPFKILKLLLQSITYFFYGVAAIIIVAVPAYIIWVLWNYTAIEGNTGSFLEVLKWALIIAGAYLGICFLGWLSKRYFFDKLSKRLAERRENEPEDKKVETV